MLILVNFDLAPPYVTKRNVFILPPSLCCITNLAVTPHPPLPRSKTSVSHMHSHYTCLKQFYTHAHTEDITRKKKEISTQKKRRSVRSATFSCWLLKSTLMKKPSNRILPLEFSFLLYLCSTLSQ